jgi:hypothetical protein
MNLREKVARKRPLSERLDRLKVKVGDTVFLDRYNTDEKMVQFSSIVKVLEVYEDESATVRDVYTEKEYLISIWRAYGYVPTRYQRLKHWLNRQSWANLLAPTALVLAVGVVILAYLWFSMH